MGVEATSLPPFSNPALSVHNHRRPRLESAHPAEVKAASDTGAGQQLRHRESVLRFSELAQVLRDWPLEFLADIAVLESDPAPLGSQTPASEAPLTQPYRKLPRLHSVQSRLALIRAAVLLSIPAFSQNSAGLPPTSGTNSAGRRHLMHCPRRSLGCVLCLEEYREGTNHQ